MTRQRQLELSRRQIPYLDDPVPSAGSEPLISRLDGGAADPPQVSGYDPHELPLGVELGFDDAGRLVQGECFGEFVGGDECGGLGSGRVVDGGNHHGRVARCCVSRKGYSLRVHERTYDLP